MTIGEKIKYLSKQKGLTQTALSALTGIHQVSITKYEKGKMIPQPDQLQQIVEALGVSPMIFFGSERFRLETRGDLMGLLINLCKSKVLVVKGKRDRNSMLIPSTVAFEFAPIISKRFTGKAERNSSFKPDEPLFVNFLKLEKLYHNYENMLKKYSGSDSGAEIAAFDELRETIEKIEIELQCSSMQLK